MKPSLLKVRDPRQVWTVLELLQLPFHTYLPVLSSMQWNMKTYVTSLVWAGLATEEFDIAFV